MYTGTFTFMPADKNWIYDPNKNPDHNCPAIINSKLIYLAGVLKSLKQNLHMMIQKTL